MLQSSILPKLLAKEDITIRHGNYHTAWFDVKNRVLGLPNWKDMGKDVYDLLCGHEVGHALFTPESGWHDSPEKLKGAPRSYLNVIEDARIEREIRNTYPGLIAAMQRGYKELLKREFFGDIYNLKWNEVKLIDKINLKTKLGTMIDVPFNSEEQVFLDRALTNKTWDQVVQLAKDILKYTQENQEELLEPQEPEISEDLQTLLDQIDELEENGDDTPLPQGHDDYPADQDGEEEQETSASGSTDSDSEDGDESDDCKETNDNSSESNDDNTPSSDEDSLEDLKAKAKELSQRPEHQPEADISATDEAFRSKEESLLETSESGSHVIINDLRDYHIKNAVIGYNQLKEERARSAEIRHINNEHRVENFKKYVKDVKRSVNFAVKEFEQRKAAYRYTRATTAKTGRLDVGKLWSYKTSEDIFSQITTLADAKNHGMIMLVDYSGSMAGSMPYVMDQLLHMVHFCKAVNIPFDVYGFTTTNTAFGTYDEDQNGPFYSQVQDGDLDMNNLSMPLVCSSSFKKKDFNDSIFHMYLRKIDSYWDDIAPISKSEEYGSTPLDQAIIVSHHLVKTFKQKHRVEKMNFVTFTDGDANGIHAYQDRKLEDKKTESARYGYGKKIAIVQKKKVYLDRYSPTESLLKNMAKTLNVKTMGFFMADDAHHWRNRISRLAHYCETDGWNSEFRKECTKEYTKNKCVHKEDAFGYDNYYLLKGGQTLSAQNEEFDEKVTEDMSDAQIRTAFRKFSKGKKTNKVLMTSIGQAVA